MVRASVTGSGGQANGASGVGSGRPALSDDGRFVAFTSDATNLVPGDTNDQLDIFVRDNLTQAVERVNVSSTGVQANAISMPASISGDGRFVSFASLASNLVPGDVNARPDIFVHDRVSDTTERLSTALAGDLPGSTLSFDGRYIAYYSHSTREVVVVDRHGGSRVLPCIGGPNVSISDDGRYVGGVSNCDGGVPGPHVYDLQTSTSRAYGCNGPARVSGNGRWVACDQYQYYSPQLDFYVKALVYDAESTSTSPATVIDTWQENNLVLGISDDGRYLAFATGLAWAADDTNGTLDAYVRDRLTGSNTLVGRGSAGQINPQGQSSVVISGDGRYVSFTSWASDFVANDTNGTVDVFVRAFPTPTVASAAPASVARGSTTVVTLHGDAMLPSSVVAVYGGGVTVNSVTWISDQELQVSITVAPDAPTGAHSYALVLPGTGPGLNAGAAAACLNCLTVS